MTINIGLLTSDAAVLGCDSVASTTTYYVDPIRLRWEQTPDGKGHARDPDGKFTLKFDYSDFEAVVTNAWGGVTKLFEIHGPPSPVAVVTAGLAKFSDMPMASLGTEFCARQKENKQNLVNVEAICKNFLTFMRKKYDEHYRGSNLPEQLREGPEFLAAGWGRDDNFPTLFRILVKQKQVTQHFNSPHLHTGVAWNGQSDAVERFIRGYDTEVRNYVTKCVTDHLKQYSTEIKKHVVDTINTVLDKAKTTLPSETEINVPDVKPISLNWDLHRTDLDYSNIPLQQAIDFVAFLVNLQGGKSLFSRGVATVGGRTHIGIITREEGFKRIGEPALQHRFTGFSE